ncbi:NifU family protein [Natronobacterium texcoconense]|uniref:Fe-S cluster biogenesis protein NfuA, 4Fe-4S-binding domain n=1 Tax=Natronobacterium texcoconense TaxID=1095778 RepID=A0A1H1IAI6_NATTX|nr:NifU family protein [Natronobacterium texcoconense]SDR34662.1 Fe-S cluster biogenesis protein NfuA, 4Fe-4S-binding domain [Natronobacterium texcoconense]
MSDSRRADADREDEVRNDVSSFLARNFPQIQGHGGDFSIVDVDVEAGHVEINLSGACTGCGVSPMTTQAIQRRLPGDVEAIDSVAVTTGFDGLGEGSSRDVPPDTPF